MSKLIAKFETIAVFDTASNAFVASLKTSVALSSGSCGGIFLVSRLSVRANSFVVYDLNSVGSSTSRVNMSLALVEDTCIALSKVILSSISLLPNFTVCHVKEQSSNGSATASARYRREAVFVLFTVSRRVSSLIVVKSVTYTRSSVDTMITRPFTDMELMES